MIQEDLEPNPNKIVDDKTSGENPITENSSPNINTSSQVFDILEDNILPAKDNVENEGKHASPPQENDLLDKKIGTFDQSPFAPKTDKITPQSSPISQIVPSPADSTVRPYPPKPTSVNGQDQQSIHPIPTQPIQNQMIQSTPKPVIQEIKQKTPNTEMPKRSLQEEAIAALPANLRNDKALQDKSIPVPKSDNQSALAKSLEDRLVSADNQRRPKFETQQEMVKPIRTYESDVADLMSHKKTSTASIVIAEKERQKTDKVSNNDEPPSQSIKKSIMAIISLLLIGGGIYGAYYLYNKSALAPVAKIVQEQKTTPSIIPSDNQAIITVDRESLSSIMQGISSEIKKDQNPNTIKEIVIAARDNSDKITRIPALEMINVLGIKPPDILSRSLTDEWMLGVYNDQDNKKSIFVAGTTNFFQNAFAGMLQWERVMADDLRQYLYPEDVEGVSNEMTVSPSPIVNDVLNGIDSILPPSLTITATNTNPYLGKIEATSTVNREPQTTEDAVTSSTTLENVQPLRKYITISGRFEDRIIKNKDVRAFRVNNGAILFLYSFFDNTHFIITDKEATLIEIIDRLEKQSFIR